MSLIQFFQEIWRAIMMSEYENIVSKARQKYVFTSACILWKSTPNIGVATSQAQKRESPKRALYFKKSELAKTMSISY